MASVLLDIRQARQRRPALVALAGAAFSLPVLGALVPALRPWVVAPTWATLVLPAVAVVVAVVAWARSKREIQWSLGDDLAWPAVLTVLGVLAALGTAPVTLGMLVHGCALLLLAVRVPPPRMILSALLSGALMVALRAAMHLSSGHLTASVLVVSLTATAHLLLSRATHSMAWLMAERDNLVSERRASSRRRERTPAATRTEREGASTALLRTSRTAASEEVTEEREAAPGEEHGWEALVERLRASMANLANAAGVVASVHAELRGLAPPNRSMRQNVIKIAQEAANQVLRDTPPANLELRLWRGEGGLLMELHDAGQGSESQRLKRALAAVRGRVTPLGGSAELRRGDVGWVVRVRIPCEQLN